MEEVGPTEEVIMGLMEFLVDPLLPSKFSSSPSLQRLLAKQFHAVVLLYNYYHIKQYPHLEFLEFESFCKLVVTLKPSLQPYFKLMQQEDYTEVGDLDKQMSLIEKAIIKSCDMCRSLDASKAHPIMKGWPITRVAVLLVDEKKENCCLFHSSITQGVWSAIEKDVKDRNQAGNVGILRQLAFSAVKDACGIHEVDLRILETHVVYSICKEKTAVRLYIMQCWKSNKNMNLIPITDVLESMEGPLVVKDSDSWITTSVVEYFHLLPFVDEVTDWISRKDLANPSQHIGLEKKDRNNTQPRKVEALADKKRFQGTDDVERDRDSRNILKETVKDLRKDCIYKFKQVPATSQHVEELKEVKHYKESPIEIKPLSKTSHYNCEAAEVAVSCNSSHVEEKKPRESLEYSSVEMEVRDGCGDHVKKEVPECSSHHSEAAKDLKHKGDLYRQVGSHETLVYKKRDRSQMDCNSEDYVDEKCAKVGTKDNMFFKSQADRAAVDGKSNILTREGHDDDDQNQIVVAEMHNQTSMTGGAILEVEKQDLALVSLNYELEHLRKLQHIIASKEPILSQAALKVLYRKRALLQHHCMMDEITSCHRNIQAILSGEDDLAMKLQTVIDGCDDICLRSITTTEDRNQLLANEEMSPVLKRKNLSEANLFVHSPCQELDGICSENYWVLPTYHVSAFKGGYRASVSIKETDFECSSEGALCQTAAEARNSAASNLLVKLRSMVAAS